MSSHIKSIIYLTLLLSIFSCTSTIKIDDDRDDDKIANTTDNCPDIANEDQLDTDNDGIGNACDDDDDNDGVKDIDDNCPLIANPDQLDTDNDGKGDVCDSAEADNDSDGIANTVDNCPDFANPDQKDSDNDGKGDVCDDTPTGIKFLAFLEKQEYILVIITTYFYTYL